MAKEVYGNAGSSFLTATINSSVTSMVVSGGTWPSSGQFTILVDSEYILVTAVTGTGPYTFTIVRGQEGSTAATHNTGTIAYINLTDGSLRRLSRQSLNGTNVSARREINILGSASIVDDPTNDKADIQIGIEVGGTLPGSPFIGQAYFLTTDSTLNIWNGSAWKKSSAYT